MSSRDEWLKERRGYVMSTDSAAIAGLSPWRTERHCYHEKVDGWVQEGLSPEMELGLFLEPYLAERWLRERPGLSLSRHDPFKVHVCEAYPFLATSLDYEADDGRFVELKTTGYFDEKWGADGSDEAPMPHLLQVQHQLLCIPHAPFAEIAAMARATGELRIYPIRRHEAIQRRIIENGRAFWERVQCRDPPDFDPGHDRTTELLQQVYPPRRGLEIEMGPEAEFVAVQYDSARRKMQDSEAMKQEARNRLWEMMGGGQRRQVAEWLGSQQVWEPINRQDSKGERTVTALATQKDKMGTLRDMLLRSKSQLETALPRHIKAEHMIRVALTAIQLTPKLMECSPLSIVGGVMRAAELGLELSGPLGQAYLIPRRNGKTKNMEANFQVGYRGLIDLCDRTGNMRSSPHVRAVKPGDTFWYRFGTSPKIHHSPCEKPTAALYTHVYAVVFDRRGGTDFEVMTRDEIMAHAKRYSQSFGYNDSPWKTAEEAMAKKTVLLRLLKRVPVSIEVRQALLKEEQPPITVDSEEAPQGRQDLLAAALAAGDPQDQVSVAPTDEQMCNQVDEPMEQREPGQEG